jgi:hypothetical protein
MRQERSDSHCSPCDRDPCQLSAVPVNAPQFPQQAPVLPGQLDFGDVCHRFQNWQFAHQCGKPHALVIDFLQSRPKIGARGETGVAFGTDLNSFAIFGVT